MRPNTRARFFLVATLTLLGLAAASTAHAWPEPVCNKTASDCHAGCQRMYPPSFDLKGSVNAICHYGCNIAYQNCRVAGPATFPTPPQPAPPAPPRRPRPDVPCRAHGPKQTCQ
jgi:hypothetical protein